MLPNLFKKNPQNPSIVTNEMNYEQSWVWFGDFIATKMHSGIACAIIDGALYKKNMNTDSTSIIGTIAFNSQDTKDRQANWLPCNRENNADKLFFECFDNLPQKTDGLYTLCGESINGNPEKFKGHTLVKQGSIEIPNLPIITFENLKDFLAQNDIEGILFYNKDNPNKMCQVKRADFGIKRGE